MKRPFASKRPLGPFASRGIFNFSNETYHSKPPSDCSKQLCYNGLDKREVIIEVRDAFISHKDSFVRDLENEGVPVDDVVVGGSIVDGDFGCRSIAKIEDEIQELKNIWVKDPETEQYVTVVEDIINESESALEIHNKVKQEVDNPIVVEDVHIAICSDIDVIVITPRTDKFNKAVGFQSPVEEFEQKMESDIDADMAVFVNSDKKVKSEVLRTEEDFNEILRRYY